MALRFITACWPETDWSEDDLRACYVFKIMRDGWLVGFYWFQIGQWPWYEDAKIAECHFVVAPHAQNHWITKKTLHGITYPLLTRGCTHMCIQGTSPRIQRMLDDLGFTPYLQLTRSVHLNMLRIG